MFCFPVLTAVELNPVELRTGYPEPSDPEPSRSNSRNRYFYPGYPSFAQTILTAVLSSRPVPPLLPLPSIRITVISLVKIEDPSLTYVLELSFENASKECCLRSPKTKFKRPFIRSYTAAPVPSRFSSLGEGIFRDVFYSKNV